MGFTVLVFLTSVCFSLPSLRQSEKTVDSSIEESNFFTQRLSSKSSEVTLYEKDFFSLNDSYLNNSDNVFSLKQKIQIPEYTYKAPEGMFFSDDGTISNIKNDIFKQDKYTEPGGYVTLTTTAYQIGLYDGHVVYHVTSNAVLEKDFIFAKKDDLIIRTDALATFYDGIPCTGKTDIYYTGGGHHDLTKSSELVPLFNRGPGVLYEFDVVQSAGPGDTYIPYQTVVTGDYYFVATDSTAVQTSYVHNQKLFSASLSVNFGYVGISIPLGWPDAAVYDATPLTLPGYADLIKREVHNLKQSDYGYEQQYFFDEQTKKHTIDGLEFTTKRLRCGYIEEEYVNLSAQRENAGTAYLEYSFEKPIFQMSTFLSFWSANERFLSDDVAYIEYLNEENKWTHFFDFFHNDSNVPTNRKEPRRFEFYFIGGTKGIRYYSHTNNPTADRNKGRICIGQTTFVTYSFK